MLSTPASRLPLIVPLLASFVACGDAPSTAGIAIGASIPPGWQYLSESGVAHAGASVRYSAADLDRAIERGRSTPLFVLTSPADRKTTVGINVTRSATVSETGPTSMLSAQISASDGALEVREAPHPARVGGHSAAVATLGDRAGNELRVAIVVVNDTAFIVAASRPDTVTAEVASLEHFFEQLVIEAPR